jgi:hypothetical protein
MISNVALDKIRRNPVHVRRGAAVEIGGPAVRPISLSRTYWGGRIGVIQ